MRLLCKMEKTSDRQHLGLGARRAKRRAVTGTGSQRQSYIRIESWRWTERSRQKPRDQGGPRSGVGGRARTPERGGLGPREGHRDQLRGRQKTRDRGARNLEKEGTDTIDRSGTEKWTEEEDTPE